MDITVFLDSPLGREPRSLPAAHYNLARILQGRSPRGVAFVPIRSMQVLAILDATEFVFVDALHKQLALLIWRDFRSKARDSLEAPVSFEAVYYRADARELQGRLQPEFFKALQVLAERSRVDGPAKLLRLDRGDSET